MFTCFFQQNYKIVYDEPFLFDIVYSPLFIKSERSEMKTWKCHDFWILSLENIAYWEKSNKKCAFSP